MKLELTPKMQLSFDVVDLLDAMTMEQKLVVARALACDNEIFAAVSDQIIDGYVSDTGHFTCSDALESQRRRILANQGGIATQVVGNLLLALKNKAHDRKRLWDWGWRMYHAWPRGHEAQRPGLPAWESQFVTDEEVQVALAPEGTE